MPRTTDAPPPALSTSSHPTATADPGRRLCAALDCTLPLAVRDATPAASVLARSHQGKRAAVGRAPGCRPGPRAGGRC
jgi:hypothetical protein